VSKQEARCFSLPQTTAQRACGKRGRRRVSRPGHPLTALVSPYSLENIASVNNYSPIPYPFVLPGALRGEKVVQPTPKNPSFLFHLSSFVVRRIMVSNYFAMRLKFSGLYGESGKD
jgi:hypothetical protein